MLNEWGQIAQSCWDDIPVHFPMVELDAFVVMPNHVHGVLVIVDDVRGMAPDTTGNRDGDRALTSDMIRVNRRGMASDTTGNHDGDQAVASDMIRVNRRGMASDKITDDRRGTASNNIADDRRGMACHAPTNGPIERKFAKPIPGSLPTIVGAFKSAVTKHINRLPTAPGHAIWQRNFYEHIIRSEDSLNTIRTYIACNPARWLEDTLYKD